MKNLYLLGFTILVSVLLIGCAKTSGVMPIGDETFMISRSEKAFDATGSGVKADAIKEAIQYCKSKNKVIKIMKVTQKDMVAFKSDPQAEIEFKCVIN